MHLVIAYDIHDDRRRARVAKLLTGCGRRVQLSVFEAHLSDRQLARVERKLRRLISPITDSVRLYDLSGPRPRQIRLLGTGTCVDPPDTIVV